MRVRKVFLVNLWPVVISLTLLIGPKNHAILETKIQFQQTQWNLTKPKVWKSHRYFGKLFLSWNWNWIRKWSWALSWRFHFTFWFNNDWYFYQIFSLFRSQHWTLYQYTVQLNHQYLMITLHWWEKCVNIKFFALDTIFEPILTFTFESRLDMSQISESVSVFVPVSFVPNQSSLKIILHCWTRMLKKMTQ